MLNTARQIALVAAPKVVGGALTLGLNILLLRIWSPEAYGIYAICTTLILLGDAVLGSSLDMATLRLAPTKGGTDPAASFAMQRAALQMKLLFAAAALPIVIVLAQPVALALFQQSGHGGLLVAAFVATVALLLCRSMLVHAQIGQRFESFALIEAVHAGVKFGGIAVLLLVVADPPVGGILALYVTGPAIAFAVGLALFRDAALWPSRLDMRRLRDLFRYVRWYALSGAAGNLIGRLDLFMLSVLATPRDVGLFAGAQTFAAVLWLVASYLAVVLSPRVMPLLERGDYRPFHRRAQSVLYATAALILVVALALLDERHVVLFPASFRESSALLRTLLIGTAMSFATFPLALPLVMFRRPRLTLVMDCVAAPVIVVLYWAAIATYGAEGAAWVTTASLIVRGGIVQAAAWRLSAEPLAPGETVPEKGIGTGAQA